jgi:tetratricopeptide (TPR) repeat protein
LDRETKRLLKAGADDTASYSDALFCARKALACGVADPERAEAKYALGVCQIHLNKPADALATFSEVATKFDMASDNDRLTWQARALFAKATALSDLGRSQEEIAVYDE